MLRKSEVQGIEIKSGHLRQPLQIDVFTMQPGRKCTKPWAGGWAPAALQSETPLTNTGHFIIPGVC